MDGRKAKGAESRAKLVRSAGEVIYHQGVERTTLADIATHAEVPVGNVYYHFKTKDDLVAAVVQGYSEGAEALMARLGRRRTPRARLKAFIDELDATRGFVATYGCPIGTLSSELDKRCGTEPSPGSQELLGAVVDWAEGQFRDMGQPHPRDLAVALIAAYEGTTLLAHSLRDPELMHRQSRRLQRWIDELPDSPDAA